MTAGLHELPVAHPGSSALAQARRRVGANPLQALSGLLAGPPAGADRWRGLLVCAIDGTTMSVPDSTANLTCYGRQSGSHGRSGYPLFRLPAGWPAAEHAVASRPQLRRRRPDRRDRRDRRRPADPVQERPPAAADRHAAGRLLADDARAGAAARDRRGDRRRHRRHPMHQPVPAAHHPDRSPAVPRPGPGRAVPPARGSRPPTWS
jgi:hypothetical protein